MLRKAILVLGISVCIVAVVGCGRKEIKLDGTYRYRQITESTSAEDLLDFLVASWPRPDICSRRIEQVGRLRTPQAARALISFGKKTGGSYYESVADALCSFGGRIARELYEVYRGPELAEYENGRLVFALAIARLSKEDDWSLNALIDICTDDYYEIQWVCKAALGRRSEKTLKLMGRRILEAKNDSEKAELEELLGQLKDFWRLSERRLDYGAAPQSPQSANEAEAPRE